MGHDAMITKGNSNSFFGSSAQLRIRRTWWKRDIRIKAYSTTVNRDDGQKKMWFFKFGGNAFQIETSIELVMLDDGQMNVVTGALKKWDGTDWRVLVQYNETCEPSSAGISDEALSSMQIGLTVATNVLCCLHGKL